MIYITDINFRKSKRFQEGKPLLMQPRMVPSNRSNSYFIDFYNHQYFQEGLALLISQKSTLLFILTNQYISQTMKKQQNNKSAVQSQKFKKYPQCANKREARMVCLNESCSEYAFFCLQCDDQSCQRLHQHQNKSDKYVAISFKEFMRRVLREKKPVEELDSAVNTYRQTLERLRQDINQFVQKELNSLTEIINKSTEVPEDLYPTIKKLKEQQYTGLLGKQMDYLWKNCGQSQQSLRIQVQTADFIKIKDQQLKAISEHFQNLNKMDIDKIQETMQNLQKESIDSKNRKGAVSPTQNNYPNPNARDQKSKYKK